MWILLGLLSAFFAALVTIIGKIALKAIDPLFINALRSIVMAITLLFIAIIYGKFNLSSLHKLSKGQIGAIILTAFAGALSWIFYFIGLKLTPKTSAFAALDKTSILLIPILALIILKETINFRAIIGAFLILIGIILMNI